MIDTSPRATEDGGGRNSSFNRPKPRAPSQQAERIATVRRPGELSRDAGEARSCAAFDVFMQHGTVTEKIRMLSCQHLIALPGDVDWYDLPELPGEPFNTATRLPR